MTGLEIYNFYCNQPDYMKRIGLIELIDRELKNAASNHKALSDIYFDIASKALGEERVCELRDEVLGH